MERSQTAATIWDKIGNIPLSSGSVNQPFPGNAFKAEQQKGWDERDLDFEKDHQTLLWPPLHRAKSTQWYR